MAPSQKTRKASLNPFGTTDRTVSFFILPNHSDATRPNCLTTLATTANHRAHDELHLAHTHKTVRAAAAAPHAHHAGRGRRYSEKTYPHALPARHRAPLAPARPGCADGGPLATCSTWQ